MGGLARQLFLGGSGAPPAQLGHGTAAAAAPGTVPGSRESSLRQGGAFFRPALAAGSAAVAAAAPPATAMVSLQGPFDPATMAGLGSPRKLGELEQALSLPPPGGEAAYALGGPAAAAGEGPRLLAPEASASGSESGRETPPAAPAALGVLGPGPHLSVSTDGVEVPTLSQLVEGASPSWRPSVAEEASLEPLALDEGPAAELQPSDLGGLLLHPSGGAPPTDAAPETAAECAPLPAPLGAFGQQQQDAQQVEQARPAVIAAPAAEEVPPPPPALQQPAAASPVASPPATPTSVLAMPAAAPAPAAPSAPSAAGGPAAAPQHPAQHSARSLAPGPAAARRPPPSPRKAKLESFDKLISKPPNAVRQVRLTSAPAPSKASALTSWLPSPGRSRSPAPGGSKPPAPSPRGPPVARTAAPATAAAPGAGELQDFAAATLAFLGVGLGEVAPHRLFRSSSDSTLFAPGSLEAPAPLQLQQKAAQAQQGQGQPQRPSLAHSGGSALAGGAAAGPSGSGSAGGTLPRRVSFDSKLASAAVAAAAASAPQMPPGAPAGAAAGPRPPLMTPPACLVVLDAWDAWGGGPTGEDAFGPRRPVDAQPAPAPPPPPPPPPRKSRFPGFSLRSFSRSKSKEGGWWWAVVGGGGWWGGGSKPKSVRKLQEGVPGQRRPSLRRSCCLVGAA